jgi:hypothetical protein
MKQAIFHIRDGEVVNKYTVKRAFELQDGSYELKIFKKSKRSLSQNAYYWGAVVKMVQEGLKDMGHDVTMDETHDFLKARFNSMEVINFETGEVLTIPKSTAQLNKEAFGIYIDNIQRFASEYLGIVIPSANEQMKIFI